MASVEHIAAAIAAAMVVTAMVAPLGAQNTQQQPSREARFAEVAGIAYASFAPLNTDLFVANADGSGIRPLLSDPANDYNASFSADGRWIVFTSERNGSADLYRA